MGDMPPGSFYSGYPARPHMDQMRVMAVEQRLPELLKTIRSLEKRVSELEGKK